MNVNKLSYICLEPTIGFNCETYSDKCDFAAWDLGGTLIYEGEQNSEYFGKGSQYGIKDFLRQIEFQGVIYVIDVSQDIERLLITKNVLHKTIFGYGQLKDAHLLIIYNEKPDIQIKEKDQ